MTAAPALPSPPPPTGLTATVAGTAAEITLTFTTTTAYTFSIPFPPSSSTSRAITADRSVTLAGGTERTVEFSPPGTDGFNNPLNAATVSEPTTNVRSFAYRFDVRWQEASQVIVAEDRAFDWEARAPAGAANPVDAADFDVTSTTDPDGDGFPNGTVTIARNTRSRTITFSLRQRRFERGR